MKFLCNILIYVLCLQLAAGTAIAQSQVAGKIGATESGIRGATHNWTDLDKLNPELTAEEKRIDTMAEAEEYLKSVKDQSEWFEQQCTVRKKDGIYVKWDTAFVLHDNIPYSDMDIKNCQHEHEKLTHMMKVANLIVDKYGIQDDLKNQSCSECGTSPDSFLNNKSDDFIPPGDKCSVGAQKAITAEACSLGDKAKAMVSFSCVGNLLKGVVLGLKDAVLGIGKLLWEGVKAIGKGIAKGVSWVGKKIWGLFSKAETKADQGIQKVSAVQEKEYKEYEKDPRSWLEKTGSKIWDVIKEIIYVGMYDRESKCMHCNEKANLLCEIGGRIFNDVIGFTFTMGVGYGAIKTMAAKLGPKLADITAKLTTKFAAAAERGGVLAKGRNVLWKSGVKTVEWVGHLPIRIANGIGKATTKMWKGFQRTWAYKAIMNPANPERSLVGLAKKGANTIPGKIILAPFKAAGWVAKKWSHLDSKVFASGAYSGVRFAWGTKEAATKLMQEMLPKLDKAEVVLDNSSTRAPGLKFEAKPDGKSFKYEVASVETNEQEIVARLEGKNRVWEAPAEYFDAEKRAQYARANIQIGNPDANGMIRVETSKKNFNKLFKQEYATKTVKVKDETFPIGYKDKKVVVKYEDVVLPPTDPKKFTKAQLEEFKAKGAIYTTTDHQNWNVPINKNKIDASLISTSLEDPGKVAAVRKGKMYIADANDLTPQKIEELKKDGYEFIKNGTDSPEVITPYDKLNRKPGQEILNSSAQKQYELTKKGKWDEKTFNALSGVDTGELRVLLTPRTESALKAQAQLAKNAKLSSASLQDIHLSWPVEPEFLDAPGQRSLYRVQIPSGDFKSIHLDPKFGKPTSFELYQGGTKAIVRNANGEAAIYELGRTENGIKIGQIGQKDEKLMKEAIGEWRNGKPMDQAELEEIEKNLKDSGKKYEWIEENGQRTALKIEMDPRCGKGFIEIPVAR